MPSRFIFRQAAQCFKQGGIIAYPTESVYGLGCDPLNFAAVERLLYLKNRRVEKGLILLSDNIDKLLPFVELSNTQRKQITQSIATTWLVNATPLTPHWVKGQHSKVAIRISHHPITKILCQYLDHPIISTSANPSHRNAAKTRLQLQQYFHQSIDFIVAGGVGELGKATPIIDIDSQRILRN